MIHIPDLPLYPVPREGWQKEYDVLVADPYLAKKSNRQRLIREKLDMIDCYCPELLKGGLNVVDIGSGMCMLGELARHFGNEYTGIDTVEGLEGMGDPYLRLATLISERQEIWVLRAKWQDIVAARIQFAKGVDLFVSQGSVEQCYSDHLAGEPHSRHHDCRKQYWIPSESLGQKLQRAFDYIASQLNPNGNFFLWANGSNNSASEGWFDETVRECAKCARLEITLHEGTRIWKWSKP